MTFDETAILELTRSVHDVSRRGATLFPSFLEETEFFQWAHKELRKIEASDLLLLLLTPYLQMAWKTEIETLRAIAAFRL